MNLIKIRFRGLGTLPESSWLDLSPGINVFEAATPRDRQGATTALEALSPPYVCEETQPFASLPTTIRKNGYLRSIAPHKRTIIIGVFAGTPHLVEQLGRISPHLYETDRIEIGRRLDYSRWFNFVELPSSTRWSEISEQIERFLQQVDPPTDQDAVILRRIATLHPTDRIKGSVSDELHAWLETCFARLSAQQQPEAAAVLEAVQRATFFNEARRIVSMHLPLVAALRLDRPERRQPDTAGSSPAALPVILTYLLAAFSDYVHAEAHHREACRRQLMSPMRNHDSDQTVQVLLNELLESPGYQAADASDILRRLLAKRDGPTRLNLTCRLLWTLCDLLGKSRPILLFSGPDPTATLKEAALIPLLDGGNPACQSIIIADARSGDGGDDGNQIRRRPHPGKCSSRR